MNTDLLSGLVLRWRTEGERFQELGQESAGQMALAYARELEEGLRQWQLEELTLDQAALESGFSYSTLQQKVRAGDIPNAGERGSPRIRRRDLPRKGGAQNGRGPDLAHEALIARLSR